MIERILRGWTWRRILYLGIGFLITIQSVIFKEWPGIILGLYFSSMGLFAFGCAGNQCLPFGNENFRPSNFSEEKVNYEEVTKNN